MDHTFENHDVQHRKDSASPCSRGSHFSADQAPGDELTHKARGVSADGHVQPQPGTPGQGLPRELHHRGHPGKAPLRGGPGAEP